MTYAEWGLAGAFSSGLGCLRYFRFLLSRSEELPCLLSDPDVVTPLPSSTSLSSRLDELRFGDANAWLSLIPLVAAIFLWSFLRTSQFGFFKCEGTSVEPFDGQV